MKPYSAERTVSLSVTLHHIGSQPIIQETLLLTWKATSDRMRLPPIQEHAVTEWAACGIACVIIPEFTPFHITNVTQRGDRFDYWVGDGSQEFGLEVSGTLSGNIAQRRRVKAKQLLENPRRVGGYVCIVRFDEQTVSLSFHRSKMEV